MNAQLPPSYEVRLHQVTSIDGPLWEAVRAFTVGVVAQFPADLQVPGRQDRLETALLHYDELTDDSKMAFGLASTGIVQALSMLLLRVSVDQVNHGDQP